MFFVFLVKVLGQGIPFYLIRSFFCNLPSSDHFRDGALTCGIFYDALPPGIFYEALSAIFSIFAMQTN